MNCVSCEGTIPDDARFCPLCGGKQPDEDPGAVDEYKTALASLANRTEAWAKAELETIRRELRIRESTHQRLLAESHSPAIDAPISVWVDAKPFAEFRSGEQCLLRIRVLNDTARPIAALSIAIDLTGMPGALTSHTDRAVGPSEDHVFSLLFRPAVGGHHQATGQLVVTPLRGAEQRWQTAEIPFLIGAAAALQQQINIDARAQRVGVFENIGGGTKGGLLADADWRLVQLRPAGDKIPAQEGPKGLPVGHQGTAVVVLQGDVVDVELDGHRGSLVDWHDPALRAVVRPGDKLKVVVIGNDGAGRPLMSTRSGAVLPAVAAGSIRVGPGDDLGAALREATAGAKIVITGVHRGPFSIDRALELSGGDNSATIESHTGPVLRISADVVLKELTVRGAAPNGQYAADAIEIRSGRVVVQECTLSSDAPGNVVPGRAVAVAGAATVELRHCMLQGSGVGVAIDVSWSGFATDTARGARVRLISCEVAGCGTGVAVAGADREVRISKTRFIGVSEAAVRVLKGGTASVEECTIPPHLLVAEPGAHLVTGRGGGR